MLSFNRPFTASFRSTNVGKENPHVILVFASSAFEHDKTSTLDLGATSCESSLWMSETSLVCKTSRGDAGSLRVHITIGQAIGSATSSVSYTAPAASTCFFANIAGTGAIRLVMSGSALGTAALSKAGRAGSSAASSTVWASDSSLSLTPCSGRVSTQEPLVLTVVQQAGSITSLDSYDRGTAPSRTRPNARAPGGPAVNTPGAARTSCVH